MFDVTLAYHLALQAFSFKKGSLRYPTAKRLLSVLIVLPILLGLILVNKFFMCLDHLFFPGFKNMRMNNAVFITGVPRSATTYLYYLLAKDEDNFTCFKLWELLFAPSIIQKHFLSWVLKLDRLIDHPLYKASKLYDRIFLAQIARLHETSLSKPEEDEILLLYAFTSSYIAYFFPDTAAMEQHLFFDEQISIAKRKKIMLFYKRCIQRHVYFHDRHENKCFLSKNPSFISKTTSVAETFENARLIYMLRSPLKTVPSTISLNKNLYSLVAGPLTTNPLADKTKDAIIRWYKMVDKSIATHWQQNHITIPFQKITRNPENTVSEIYSFLKLTPSCEMNRILKVEQENSLAHVSTHEYKIVAEDKGLIRELDFIFNGPFRNDL